MKRFTLASLIQNTPTSEHHETRKEMADTDRTVIYIFWHVVNIMILREVFLL